jgi:hypothetical protein
VGNSSRSTDVGEVDRVLSGHHHHHHDDDGGDDYLVLDRSQSRAMRASRP